MADLAAFIRWIDDFAATVVDNSANLTELDKAIGDADHGSNMARGLKSVVSQTEGQEFAGIDAYLKKVGMTLVSTVGGASGPLYGTFFLRMAGPLAGVEDADAAAVGAALQAGVEGILARGKAEAGDKTLYDAWLPALEAFEASVAAGLGPALAAAAEASAQGRDATADLVARKGRASYLGERSKGHIDPGAASTTLLLESAARTLS